MRLILVFVDTAVPLLWTLCVSLPWGALGKQGRKKAPENRNIPTQSPVGQSLPDKHPNPRVSFAKQKQFRGIPLKDAKINHEMLLLRTQLQGNIPNSWICAASAAKN